MAHPLPRRTLLTAPIGLLGTGCAPAHEKRSDRLIVGGRVYTVDPRRPWAEAVAISGDRIQAVGSRAELDPLVGPRTEIIDAEGGLVLPGFHDVHCHPIEGLSGQTEDDCLLDFDADARRLVQQVRACAGHGRHGWVTGYGFDITRLHPSERAPRDLLDAAVPDRPALLYDQNGHAAWLNSRALTALGIDRDTPEVAGGLILRGPGGEPNGLLLDNAMMVYSNELVRSLPSDEYPVLLASQRKLAEAGITSVADARVTWRGRHHQLDLWQRAEREGRLAARTTLGLWAYPELEDDLQLPALTGAFRHRPGGMLSTGEVKICADGITSNLTAALLEPYLIDTPVPGDRGLNYFDADRLARYVTRLERTGFTVHIHAIGDRGIREALDAVETARRANGDLGARHRITHIEYPHPDDLPRFARLGVVADFQTSAPGIDVPAYRRGDEPVLGRERTGRLQPIRALMNNGATVTLSSDFNVGALSPLPNIAASLRIGPHAVPSLGHAIRAYTLNAAYALRQERFTGSIEPGKLADLVILDRDLFARPAGEIEQATVRHTLLGGRHTFGPAGEGHASRFTG
ncbi:amidohydrolase [Nonomuraea sp. NPDC059023]|uniref:amidohydrolase n=1 Tax=unclassified Nonomuraea TaxID=2593643 RepID=UPI00368BF137